jgi:hypothetical protein
MTFLNESGDQKLLPVSYIATDTGAASLELSPNDRDLSSETFTVRLADRRPATAEDPKRIEAGKSVQIGGQKQDLEQALASFEAALPLWLVDPQKKTILVNYALQISSNGGPRGAGDTSCPGSGIIRWQRGPFTWVHSRRRRSSGDLPSKPVNCRIPNWVAAPEPLAAAG